MSDNPLESQLAVGCSFFVYVRFAEEFTSASLLNGRKPDKKTIETYPVMFGRRIAEMLAWPKEKRVRHYITTVGAGKAQWL